MDTGITFIRGTTTGLDDEDGDPSDGGCCDDDDVVEVAIVVAVDGFTSVDVESVPFELGCRSASSNSLISESEGSTGS